MLCRNCSSEFTPPPEEARLIALGDLIPLCPKCVPAAALLPPKIEDPEADKVAQTLWRAERRDFAGKVVAFMRLPKITKPPIISPLVKPRSDQLHVFVMSEGNPSLKSSSPRVILHTNLETFMENKQNFWVKKLPSFWDGPTGVGHIEIKLEDVVDIIKEKNLVRVRCIDKSEVLLHYK